MKYFLYLLFFFSVACKTGDNRFSKDSSGILYNLKDYSYFNYQQIKDPDFPVLPVKPPFPGLEFEVIDPTIVPFPIIDLLKPTPEEIAKVDCAKRDEVLAQLGRLKYTTNRPENGFVLQGFDCRNNAGENCALADITSVGWYVSSDIQFRVIPLHILCLTGLKFVSIVDFQLGALGMNEFISEPVLEHFKTISLEGLRLNDNQFTTIPLSIFELEDLKILSLSGNELISHIPSLKKLSKLKELYLSGLSLENLGEIPSSDLNLDVLYVNNNKKFFSFSVNDSPLRAKIFSATNSKVINFTESLVQMQVQSMDLSNNSSISMLPSFSMVNNYTLNTLKLNSLTTWDANVLQWGKSLKVLDFSGSKIAKITGDFSNCHVLDKIDLSGNQIKAVPLSLGQCAKSLILDHNQIQTIDELLNTWNNNNNNNIGATLSVQYNQIQNLEAVNSQSIWGLVDLQHNDLTYNSDHWKALRDLNLQIILSQDQFSDDERLQMNLDFGNKIQFK